jgi:Ohr subfamily peroxiredoxin
MAMAPLAPEPPSGHIPASRQQSEGRIMKALYTSTVTATGGRGNGTARSPDGLVDFRIGTPKELGGKDDGYNPEQLFAAGYSNCYLGAIKAVAAKEQPPVRIAPESTVTAKVTLGSRDDGGGFELAVAMDVHLPGVDKAKAEEIARKAHTVCPYSWSIRGNVDVKTEVV